MKSKLFLQSKFSWLEKYCSLLIVIDKQGNCTTLFYCPQVNSTEYLTCTCTSAMLSSC